MLKKIFTLLICIISFSNLNAEVVKKIIIEGNNRISEETIKVYGEIEIDKNYSEIDLNNVTNNLYSTEFFENVNLSLKNQILKITVKEYPIINQLIILEFGTMFSWSTCSGTCLYKRENHNNYVKIRNQRK